MDTGRELAPALKYGRSALDAALGAFRGLSPAADGPVTGVTPHDDEGDVHALLNAIAMRGQMPQGMSTLLKQVNDAVGPATSSLGDRQERDDQATTLARNRVLERLTEVLQLSRPQDLQLLEDVAQATADGEQVRYSLSDLTSGNQTRRKLLVEILQEGEWRQLANVDVAPAGDEGRANQPHFSGDPRLAVTAVSRDGTLLATNSGDWKTHLWELATGRHRAEFAHIGNMAAVAFSRDSSQIAITGGGLDVRLWEVADSREVARLNHNRAEALAFSPDGTLLATGSSWPKQTVRLWRIAAGDNRRRSKQRIGQLQGELRQEDGPFAARAGFSLLFRSPMTLAFSPDGSRIASACGPNARLWDVASRREIARMEHAAAIRAMSFNHDGSLFATCGDDTTARLWTA